ncbi:helix-turn-helix domain-containing protein [Hymenobacter metallicola]|uniref:Helix-turn-helix domain-containing protein n=1 Tax=Hymenobacter metallicola TaxID=2563114 RepID=A0A4Z0QH13_9BACT|nr:helix-turn-helix domain-containing protein [Hymenobacter metallicola]TGE28766.1 helix-turn-helix domain-containing protein [Hymenobacter metallicola]
MFSAARIQSIRKSKGLSQEVLAEQSGVSLRTIQRVEQGETVPRGHTLQALAAALDVTLEALRTEPEAPRSAPVDFVPSPAPEAVAATQTLAPPAVEAAAPGSQPVPALRSDPGFVQLLNLSALSFLAFPFLNIVVPLLLWRARRHDTEHVAEIGRRVLGFQVLWQVGCFFAYMLVVLGNILAARYRLPVSAGGYVGVLLFSYALNVLTIVYQGAQLRRGNLDVYRVRF